MQGLDSLWKAVNLVSSVRNLAVETKIYQWEITPPITFFLDVEYADVTLTRHELPMISAKIELQAGFGWQVATDQDDAGVYIIAKRKPLIGTMGRGNFYIALPHDIHVTLKLEHCQLTLDDLNTTLDFPVHDASSTKIS
jgi:hypothetical protein